MSNDSDPTPECEPADLARLDQVTARALVDAGYMPLARYLELCQARGWKADLPSND